MPIQVLFFGATADIAATRQIDLQATDGITANAALAKIVEQIPGLVAHQLHISVNQQYASGDDMIRDGDEVAIFTAVSGG